jgi:hypothetical protein
MAGGNQFQYVWSLHEDDRYLGGSRERTLLRCVRSRAHFNCRYVFFEKKRIAEGKQKGEVRLKQETTFPGGRELRRRNHAWLPAGEDWHRDNLGRMVITGGGQTRTIS